jgi:hypothetical protein
MWMLWVLKISFIIEFMVRSGINFRFQMTNTLVRLILKFMYMWCAAVDPQARDDLKWLMPALVLCNLSKPVIWAMVTVFESSSCATQQNFDDMKAKTLKRRRWYDIMFCVVWFSLLSAFCARVGNGANFLNWG